MPIRVWCVCVLVLWAAAATASAQFKQGDPQGIKLGEARVQQWRCGMTVHAGAGPCRGIVGYAPVPIDWPEQVVKIIDEDVTSNAQVRYQTVDDTVRVMVVRVPFLGAGEEAQAVVTFEVRRSVILAPDDPAQYLLPDTRKLDRKLRPYLAPSPKIESTDRRIRQLAKEIGVDEPTAWGRVEAIYDWVRENVEYKNGPLKGAVAALQDGWGDCEELTSLFIAICRAADVPARTVWVQGHCYAEFYLVDAEGQGHWFPCQAAGSRAFGELPEFRPVLQKGDNFRPPWNRRDRQRYLAEHLTGAGGRPRVRFIREPVGE